MAWIPYAQRDGLTQQTYTLLRKRNCLIRRKQVRLIKLKRKQYNVRVRHAKALYMNEGYDFLEYYFAVKRYFCKKYDLSLTLYESLFYLYCRSYFTRKDFTKFPLDFGDKNMQSMVKKGFFINLFPERRTGRIYRLSSSATAIVRDTHDMLSGVKKLPSNVTSNRFLLKNLTPQEEKTRDLLKEMKDTMRIKSNGFELFELEDVE